MTAGPPRYESPNAGVHVKEFLAWTGHAHGEIPTRGELMEYLWGEIPLRYGDSPEVAEEHRVTVGQYLARLRKEFGTTEVENLTWDKRTFQRRLRDLNRVSRELWLYELRNMVENEGHEPRAGSPWAAARFPSAEVAFDDAPPFDLPRGFKGFPPFERLAAESSVISDIRALLDVIGEGSKLTAKGNLSLSDARRVAGRIGIGWDFDERIGDKIFKTKSSTEIELIDLAFRWARAAGFVKVSKGLVAATKRGKAFGSKPAEEWWSLFISFVRDLRWPTKRYPVGRKPFWAEEVAVLWRYYLESMRLPAIDIGELRNLAWERAAFIYDVDDLTPDQVHRQIDMVEGAILHGFFEPLAMLNAVDAATLKSPPLRATVLGRWAAERFVFLMEGAADEAREGNVIYLKDRRDSSN